MVEVDFVFQDLCLLSMVSFVKPQSRAYTSSHSQRYLGQRPRFWGEAICSKEVISNWMVVLKSNDHFPLCARERVRRLADHNSLLELDHHLISACLLGFGDAISYLDKLIHCQDNSGLNDRLPGDAVESPDR
jgi:acetyl-CoA carboxylase beta subunit